MEAHGVLCRDEVEPPLSSTLQLEGRRLTLGGARGARLFRREAEPQELAPGSDLSLLL